MTITSEQIKDFVEKNPRLVRRRATPYPGLYVLKYHNRVFYKGLWNDILEECRGTVVDRDYNIVSLPIRKMYNYGIEQRAPKFSMDEIVYVARKINGFMAAATEYNGEILVSTTGSLSSEYVDKAWKNFEASITWEDLWKPLILEHGKRYTFLFEIVDEQDPHIIPEEPGIYFLGSREKVWGSNFDLYTPIGSLGTPCFGDVLEKLKTCKHEGFVVQSLDGERMTKMKSPYYLTKKFLARARPEILMEKSAKQRVEEEYYNLVDNIQVNIDFFKNLNEQGRLNYVRNFLEKNPTTIQNEL